MTIWVAHWDSGGFEAYENFGLLVKQIDDAGYGDRDVYGSEREGWLQVGDKVRAARVTVIKQ